jgi:hypothetical protein
MAVSYATILREGVIGSRKRDEVTVGHWPALAGVSEGGEESHEDENEGEGMHCGLGCQESYVGEGPVGGEVLSKTWCRTKVFERCRRYK